MFNFTTQTVYNSITTEGANKNMWVSDGERPALRIGNTRFDKADILDIQMKNPTVENLASVTFDMNKILIAEDSTDNEITARIALYIGLSMNSQDSFYANDLVYKGKPLFVEFAVKKSDNAATIAQRVKANAIKFLLLSMGSEKILDVIVDGGSVTFEGVNGYQQIKHAALQKFDPLAKTVDCCSNQGEYVDVIVGVPVSYNIDENGVVTVISKKLTNEGQLVNLEANEVGIAPGIEAFGDYNWIIHNLRLPTAMNTNFWAPTRDEMPVVGQQYTQFIIRILKERDGIMGEIVGARGTSVTTHVLYVAGNASDLTSPAGLVKAELTKLGTIKSTADDVLKLPYKSVDDVIVN